MEHTIYLDILFCVNFVVDYILLLTVRRFLSLSCRRRRLLAGAAAGGLLSCVILLPPMPFVVSLAVDILSACIVVAAAFAPMGRPEFIRTAFVFFAVSFVYCGMMIAVWIIFSPGNIVVRNSSVYIGVSPAVLIITTLVCYLILKLFFWIGAKSVPEKIICSAEITLTGKATVVSGRLDSGSELREPFSGEYVIVVRESALPQLRLREALSRETPEISDAQVRLIPFSSVGGEGILPAVRCDKVIIRQGKKEYRVRAYIAVCSDNAIKGREDSVIPYGLIAF